MSRVSSVCVRCAGSESGRRLDLSVSLALPRHSHQTRELPVPPPPCGVESASSVGALVRLAGPEVPEGTP